jgi:argininosuccinate synthase
MMSTKSTAKPTAKPIVKKCVLAYSGGLDTSIIIPWLRNNYGCEIIAFCANLGQTGELEGLEEKALATGASKCYVEDLREEFLRDYVFPTMQAGAIYERDYLLGTSMARPLIAKKMVEIAEKEGADAVAHGATGKGNDQVRFELTVMALNPRLRIIAPWREWDIRGRTDALEYAAEYNVPVKATAQRIYSQDRNLWHLSNEGGALEDPWNEPPADMFEWTSAPEQAPDEPEYVELRLDRETLHYKQSVGLRYAELVYNGQWFAQLREALDAFVQFTEQNITGTVRLKLYKGNIILAGRKSPYSLYREDYVTFEGDDVYNQADAEGFIRLFGLPLKVAGMLKVGAQDNNG